MERLTALVVPRAGRAVPRRAAAGGADGRRRARPAPSASSVLAWDETDDPFALLARTADRPPRVGARRGSPSAPAPGPSTRSASSGRCPARRWSSPARSSTGCAWSSPPAEVEELAARRRRHRPGARPHGREWLRVGRTEAEVGADIAAAILEEGHVGVDFTIVGSGPNGASPHHELSDRDGRRPATSSSSTSAGRPPPATGRTAPAPTSSAAPPAADVAEWYAVLQAAQEAATAAVRPGRDRASRSTPPPAG